VARHHGFKERAACEAMDVRLDRVEDAAEGERFEREAP